MRRLLLKVHAEKELGASCELQKLWPAIGGCLETCVLAEAARVSHLREAIARLSDLLVVYERTVAVHERAALHTRLELFCSVPF